MAQEQQKNESITLDINVDPVTNEGAFDILARVKPDWKADQIQCIQFKDGITNRIIGFHLENAKDEIVMMRCYGEGTEMFIDRGMEIKNMKKLHKAGCAGELYAIFNNGLCYEYITGEPTSTESIREEVISRIVAEEMAKIHSIVPEPNEDTSVGMFLKIRDLLNLFPKKFENAEKQLRFENDYPSVEKMKDELRDLEDHLNSLHLPVVFCHNDLLLGNIIYNSKTSDITFIDFEYGMYNYQPYDIANHFNEFAGIEVVDYSLYPSRQFQCDWLKYYLEKYRQLNNNTDPVTDDDIQTLYVQVNKCALASHLFWSVWAIVQERYSSLGYDFLSYAIVRYNEYKNKKDEFLSLKTPST